MIHSSPPFFQYSDSLLLQYVEELGSHDEWTRRKAAKDLRIYAETEAKEMLGVTFGKFMDDLSNKIYQLIIQGDAHHRLGGLCALDELIDVHTNYGEEREVKNMRFVAFLRHIFQQNFPKGERVDDSQHLIILKATQSLGHIARSGGNWNMANVVQYELKSSFDWLTGDQEDEYHRLAAVYILKEVAENAPLLFKSHIDSFFRNIWLALRDAHSEKIRIGALHAVHAVLQLISSREEISVRTKWYEFTLSKMKAGLFSLDPAVVDGSFRILGEILQPCNFPKEFIAPHFEDACRLVFGFESSFNTNVQHSMISLLPLLAKFDSNRFTQGKYLDRTMRYLLKHLDATSSVECRHLAFVAIGDVASAVTCQISPHISAIISHLRDALAAKPTSAGQPSEVGDALQCISKLVKAMRTNFETQIHSLIHGMFAGGLSETLLETLQESVDSIPVLLPIVRNGLFKCISEMVMQLNEEAKEETDQNTAECNTRRESITLLSLTALGQFRVDDQVCNSFIIHCILRLLEHPNSSIRRKAALTTCKLLFPPTLLSSDISTFLSENSLAASNPEAAIPLVSSMYSPVFPSRV
ncbi:putative Target of rapamycin [Cardiosporidium cionae]|uniref:Target of rapamycin n=1 Tax=Cardiosporidium cionae TaxID=476202 RepID=A0ABQ7J6F1_9APIC|nr:putative Target of rapamycin [Cardiosporidium cionae]|eukprot:KAF8819571.1 putative Target of rapamycin [Cardiosporidium cionae]